LRIGRARDYDPGPVTAGWRGYRPHGGVMQEPTRREFLAGAAGALGLTAGLSRDRRTHPFRSPGSAAPGSQRYDLVIRGGRVIDPANGVSALRDVAILDGRIARVAESIAADGARSAYDATGRIVTPGLIDVHVHVYEGVSSVGIDPDVIGIGRGVTALIDGGSAGATTFPGFRQYIVNRARTRVYALLNIATPGMTVRNETADMTLLDADATAQAVRANRDIIVGIKVRMLAGIPDGADIEVMRRTRAAADAAEVPVMVHIGGQTSPLPRILDLLRPGDIVTHAMRRQGSVLDGNGRVMPEVLEAVRNGVHLDVGHGRGNLDFDVAEQILAQGVRPTVISSDVHTGNAAGPVFDLPTTLSKFLHMGMTLEQVIECATATPAKLFAFGRELGTLAEGTPADIAIFELTEGDYPLMDSGGKVRRARRRLVPHAALREGRPFGSINT
jgi:dihydroorotase